MAKLLGMTHCYFNIVFCSFSVLKEYCHCIGNLHRNVNCVEIPASWVERICR